MSAEALSCKVDTGHPAPRHIAGAGHCFDFGKNLIHASVSEIDLKQNAEPSCQVPYVQIGLIFLGPSYSADFLLEEKLPNRAVHF